MVDQRNYLVDWEVYSELQRKLKKERQQADQSIAEPVLGKILLRI